MGLARAEAARRARVERRVEVFILILSCGGVLVWVGSWKLGMLGWLMDRFVDERGREGKGMARGTYMPIAFERKEEEREHRTLSMPTSVGRTVPRIRTLSGQCHKKRHQPLRRTSPCRGALSSRWYLPLGPIRTILGICSIHHDDDSNQVKLHNLTREHLLRI
jgi:hypothetical protein